MARTLSLQDWLGRIDAEYLSSFIRDGGASVRFVVTPDVLQTDLETALSRRCRELDYLFAKFDAAASRAHMPQDLFFALARQIDWRRTARRFILRLAAGADYRTEGLDAAAEGNVFDAIAAANGGLERQFVLQALRPAVQKRVFRNRNLVRDFRVVMTALCQHEEGGGVEYSGGPLLDWLRGHNPRVSSIRPLPVYTAVNRTTARYFVESTLHWVRDAGYSGTVLVLNNRRVTVARNRKDGGRYYTRAMAMDHYELLREFVDDVDRLAGALMLVTTGEGFLDDDSRGRGFGSYPALKTRVMDDVRDRNLVNPVASLVRLSQESRNGEAA
jgi:hypothetical protein